MSMLKQKQVELSRERLLMFIERILNEIFRKETGASRLQQVGLFTLIYVLQGRPPVTATGIAQMTRQSPSQIHRQLKKLLRLKLIKRKKIRNKQGRGHAFALTISDTKQTRKLVKAITNAGLGGARRKANPAP